MTNLRDLRSVSDLIAALETNSLDPFPFDFFQEFFLAVAEGGSFGLDLAADFGDSTSSWRSGLGEFYADFGTKLAPKERALFSYANFREQEIDREELRHLLELVKQMDPRYLRHVAEVRARKDAAENAPRARGMGLDTGALDEVDRHLIAHLAGAESGPRESGEAPQLRDDPQQSHGELKKVAAKARAEEAGKTASGSKKANKAGKALKDNFTKGQLVNEKAGGGGRKKADVDEDFSDDISCPQCEMCFTTPKKLQEHFKKMPDHDPATAAMAEARAQELLRDSVVAAENQKPTQKRHGHRKF